MKTLKLLVAAGALAVVLAGCGSTTEGHDMGGTATPTSAPTASGAGTPAAGPHDDADVMFATMMVPHHRQAVEMADMLLGKQGIDPEVTALATKIKAAQAPEIDQMNGWLTGWGESTASSMPMDHDTGGGMMSQDQMDALDKAAGDEAAKLFLSGMVAHHQGAVAMAETELAEGQNPDAKALAQAVRDSQQAEITTMEQLLARG